MTAEIDRARLIEIAERIRRGARHPDVLALCDGVLALAITPPKPVGLMDHCEQGSPGRPPSGPDCSV
jgi:hypothetical protein